MNRWIRFAAISAAVAIPAALFGPFFIPVRPLPGLVAPEKLADPDSHFAGINGLRVHYKIAGQGRPAMILLHGLAASIFSWREVMVPLAEHGTVVAFDRPAFGLTSRPLAGQWLGRNPYSQEAQADLTVALMDHLGIEKAVLIGNSLGGMVAALTALRYPERVERLVLVDPAVYLPDPPVWLRRLVRTAQLRHLGPLLARWLAGRRDSVIRLVLHDQTKASPELLAGYLKPTQVKHWDRALWEFVMAAQPVHLPQRLHLIQQPTLVVTGDDDRVILTRHTMRLADRLSQAQLAVIPNCGHLPQEECPAEFLEAVLNWLAMTDTAEQPAAVA